MWDVLFHRPGVKFELCPLLAVRPWTVTCSGNSAQEPNIERQKSHPSGLQQDYTSEYTQSAFRASGSWQELCTCCDLLWNMHACPPCLLRGAQMRSCLQKGCASLGKVVQTPGAITTCRLSRPETPMTGPSWGAVPGGAGCVCAAGRGRRSGNSCACSEGEYTFQSQSEILCVLSIVLCYLACCSSLVLEKTQS